MGVNTLAIISVKASLQEGKEEPIATMIARFLYGYLLEAYPSCGVYIFDRERYPGMGDCFLRARADMKAVGTDIAHDVHVDAYVPEAYGFTSLYNSDYGTYDYAVDIEKGLAYALADYIPKYTKDRGTSNRHDIAILKMYCTLSEVGFYTNIHEYELLQQQWYCALVAWGLYKGMETHIFEKFGIRPNEEEEDDMAGFKEFAGAQKDEKGRNMIVCSDASCDKLLLINAWSATDVEAEIFILEYAQGRCVGKKFGLGGWSNKLGNHGAMIKLSQEFGELKNPFAVEVHCVAPVSAEFQK